MGMWSLIGVGLLFLLLTRDRLEVNVQHDRNPVAIKLSDGSVRNGYTMKILNMMPEPRTITLSIDGPPGASMTITEHGRSDRPQRPCPVEPDKLRALHVFVTVPPQLLQAGRRNFKIVVTDEQSFETDSLPGHLRSSGEHEMSGSSKRARIHRQAHAGHHARLLRNRVLAANMTMVYFASVTAGPDLSSRTPMWQARNSTKRPALDAWSAADVHPVVSLRLALLR
jgi:hypothetical protein